MAGSEGISFGQEVGSILISDTVLEFANEFDVEFSVLVTFDVFLDVFSELKVSQGVLSLIDLELVVKEFKHLLFHFV